MGRFRTFWSGINDLLTVISLSQGLWWVLGIAGLSTGFEMVMAKLGASPLEAIGYALLFALVLALCLIAYRLYQMNKPFASIKCAEIEYEWKYPNVQIAFLTFIGVGACTRMEVYCLKAEAFGGHAHALQILAKSPGHPFTLSRTETESVELIRYDQSRPTPTITVTIPTKAPVEEWQAGDRFRLFVTAYAGLVREEITVDCWIDPSSNELNMEEVKA